MDTVAEMGIILTDLISFRKAIEAAERGVLFQ